MSEKYTFYKSHKVEDWIASEMRDTVTAQILEWFDVEEIGHLTEDQIAEITDYRDNVLNEYSPLQWGYSDVIGEWENYQWENSE